MPGRLYMLLKLCSWLTHTFVPLILGACSGAPRQAPPCAHLHRHQRDPHAAQAAHDSRPGELPRRATQGVTRVLGAKAGVAALHAHPCQQRDTCSSKLRMTPTDQVSCLGGQSLQGQGMVWLLFKLHIAAVIHNLPHCLICLFLQVVEAAVNTVKYLRFLG